MKIRRYVARDMRTALVQIKEELGADAVIMSNKKIPEGVELMAAVDYNQSTNGAEPDPSQNIQDPNSAVNVGDQGLSSREINNDRVTLGSQAPNQSVHSGIAKSVKDSPEADSLSALLNRKIQASPTPAISHEQNNMQSPLNMSHANNDANDSGYNPVMTANQELGQEDIELQFKSFTDRLQNSVQSAVQPYIAEDTKADSNARSAGYNQVSQQHSAEISQSVNVNNVNRQVGDSSIQKNTANGNSEINNTARNNYTDNSYVGNSGQNNAEMENMRREMASIRQLLEHQISGLMWQDMAQKDPARAMLVDRLTALGLTEQVADQVAGYVPAKMNEDDAWGYALESVSDQINTTNNDIIHRGGVVALVGPTGVGKTTTIAKLAARFAQIHGANQVALISTDSFRIAGFEQLETYGRIIGCQVKLAKDDATLDALLQQYSKKKLVLIDTAGMGQRDLRLAENLTQLIANARVKIRNYLVLSANTQQRVMQENVERFKKVPLSGCIYTKLDESLSIGEIISTSIQNGLPIGYLTDGQRVPEDIKVANAEKLVTLADKMSARIPSGNSAQWKSFSQVSASVA